MRVENVWLTREVTGVLEVVDGREELPVSIIGSSRKAGRA